MTLRVAVLNLDEIDARADVWRDESLDLFAERWAEDIERRSGQVGWTSWPVLTDWSASSFFWRDAGDNQRELHNVAPYAPAVERGFRFLQGGHPSGMAEHSYNQLAADQINLLSIGRTADQYAARGPRGEHRPGVRPHQNTPIATTAAALFNHRYAEIGPFPGQDVVENFTAELRGVRLSGRAARGTGSRG